MRELVTLLLAFCTLCGSTSGAVVYVDGDAPPGGDGASWASAFQHPELAVAVLEATPEENREIRIAGGQYGPGETSARGLVLPAGTDIRGGYAGIGRSDPDARSSKLYPTVLDFPIGLERPSDRDRPTLPYAEIEFIEITARASRFLLSRDFYFGRLSVPDHDLRIEGCVFDGNGDEPFSFLTNFRGDSTFPEEFPGPHPTIEILDCTFRNSRSFPTSLAKVRLICESIRIEDCVFDDVAPLHEQSPQPAVVVFLTSQLRQQSAVVRGCRFSDNASNCLVIRRAGSNALSNRLGMDVLVEDCVFERNEAGCVNLLGPDAAAFNATSEIEPGEVDLVLRNCEFLDCTDGPRAGPDTRMVLLYASVNPFGFENYESRIEASGLRFERCRRIPFPPPYRSPESFDGELMDVVGDDVDFTDVWFDECYGHTTLSGIDLHVDRSRWVRCTAPEGMLYAFPRASEPAGLLSGLLFAGNTVEAGRGNDRAVLVGTFARVRGITAVGNWFLPFRGDEVYPPGELVVAEFMYLAEEPFDEMSSVLAANVELDANGMRPAFGFPQGLSGTSYVETSADPRFIADLFQHPRGPDGIAYSGDEDWRPGSALQDRGNSSLAPPTDHGGNLRVRDGGQGCLVDIGAFEWGGLACACPADKTTMPTDGIPNGIVDGADLSFFVENWLAGAPVADVTFLHTNPGDFLYGASDGRVDGGDLAYFVEAWLLGCN